MRNGIIEAMLYSHPDLIWEYRDSIPLNAIDRKKSHLNQARVSEPIITDLVNEYFAAVKNGAEFPAIVVYEDSDNVFVNIDGNHRTEAYLKAKKETIDAYVVLTTDPLERVLLTDECNGYNGLPSSREDKIAHAINLVHQGFVVSEVSDRLHLSTATVYEGLSDYDGHLRARGLGIQSPWAKIEARGTRVRLHNGLTLDKVFSLAVQFVSSFGMTTPETKKFITAIKENTSEIEQLNYIREVIAAAEKAKEDKNKGNYLRLPQNVVKIHCAYWAKTDFSSVVQAMTAEERTELRSQVLQAQTGVSKLLAAIG